MNPKNAMSLVELLVTVSIMATMAVIGVPQLLPMIKEFSLKENSLEVARIINEARGMAIKQSRSVYVNLSQASTEHGNDGGLIEIERSDGTVLNSFYLSENIRINAGQSTVKNQEIGFDYRGRPADRDGTADTYSASNNKVVVSFYKPNGDAVISKTILINPITGKPSVE